MKLCKKDNKTGRIHSFESFGAHDGPGIRFVVFMQGCRGRCLYCQNPDTWKINAGKKFAAGEVFQKIERCFDYLRFSGGGVTVSGGEPLLQMGFLIELFGLCKNKGIHTAIDTSVFSGQRDTRKLKRLISLTDLFIVDIKAADSSLHKKITSRELDEPLSFIEILEESRRLYWIRYVLIPGLNDSKKDLAALKKILARLKCCEKLEFLPYHTLGRHKWKGLGLKYHLNKIPSATAKDIKRAEKNLGLY